MKNKMRCISFCFSTFIFLALIGGCVSTGVTYFPDSVASTPAANLVKVIIPDTEKLVSIDGKKVSNAPLVYVLPGNHSYTFSINYRSTTYCTGPSYGLKATRDVIVKNGEASSVVFMRGDYSTDVSAKAGQTVQFKYSPNPDCKVNLDDYFQITVSK